MSRLRNGRGPATEPKARGRPEKLPAVRKMPQYRPPAQVVVVPDDTTFPGGSDDRDAERVIPVDSGAGEPADDRRVDPQPSAKEAGIGWMDRLRRDYKEVSREA